MQRLTIAHFENADFTGEVHAGTVRTTSDSSTLALAHGKAHNSVLVRIRPNDEVILELTPIVNTPRRRRRVENAFPDDVNLDSRLRAGMIWSNALDGDFGDFSALTFLLDFNFDIEIELPPRQNIACFGRDVEGTVHYFMHLFIDEGQISVRVVGGTSHLEGGGWCLKNRIRPRVRDAISNGADMIQDEIDTLLATLSGVTFSEVYLLPGDGDYDGIETFSDARNEAALVLVRV